MIAIISNGDYTAHLQLPAERKQLAGVLSYLGANHANDYDVKYNEDSDSKLWFSLDCRGVVENAIAKVLTSRTVVPKSISKSSLRGYICERK